MQCPAGCDGSRIIARCSPWVMSNKNQSVSSAEEGCHKRKSTTRAGSGRIGPVFVFQAKYGNVCAWGPIGRSDVGAMLLVLSIDRTSDACRTTWRESEQIARSRDGASRPPSAYMRQKCSIIVCTHKKTNMFTYSRDNCYVAPEQCGRTQTKSALKQRWRGWRIITKPRSHKPHFNCCALSPFWRMSKPLVDGFKLIIASLTARAVRSDWLDANAFSEYRFPFLYSLDYSVLNHVLLHANIHKFMHKSKKTIR